MGKLKREKETMHDIVDYLGNKQRERQEQEEIARRRFWILRDLLVARDNELFEKYGGWVNLNILYAIEEELYKKENMTDKQARDMLKRDLEFLSKKRYIETKVIMLKDRNIRKYRAYFGTEVELYVFGHKIPIEEFMDEESEIIRIWRLQKKRENRLAEICNIPTHISQIYKQARSLYNNEKELKEHLKLLLEDGFLHRVSFLKPEGDDYLIISKPAIYRARLWN